MPNKRTGFEKIHFSFHETYVEYDWNIQFKLFFIFLETSKLSRLFGVKCKNVIKNPENVLKIQHSYEIGFVIERQNSLKGLLVS